MSFKEATSASVINVVVPCYNHEKYIPECIHSITHAYSGGIHIVACDDCSTDNSFQILSNCLIEARKNNNKLTYELLKNEKNKGISETLNFCLEKCDKDIIYLIASDDSLISKSLDNTVAFLYKSKADAVISDCVIIDEESSVCYDSAFFGFRHSNKKKLLTNKISDELVFNWVVPGPALLLKRNIYNKIGRYDPSCRAEDRDFYLRLLSKCHVVFNEIPVANYRVHSKNFSGSKSYLENANKEFARVNYKYSKNYSGLAKLYLWSYSIDMSGRYFFVAKIFRKILKLCYSFNLSVKRK